MIITVSGHIPGKKNLYRRSKNGGMFRDKEVAGRIDEIIREILAQVGNLEPFIKPEIKAHFYCGNSNSDLDNKWTTLQDCLVKSGVIQNDNMKHLPGPITFYGEKSEMDFVEIEIKDGV